MRTAFTDSDRSVSDRSVRRVRRLGLVPLLLAGAMLVPSSAVAEEARPRWTVTAVSMPTYFPPGAESGKDVYRVEVTNTGSGAAGCTKGDYEAEVAAHAEPVFCPQDSPVASPIAISDLLPEGLTLDRAGVDAFARAPNSKVPLSCEGLSCTYSGVVIPDEALVVTVPVDVEPAQALGAPSCEVPAGAVSCVTNEVRVSGGGAADASMRTATTIGSGTAPFGIAAGSATTSLSSVQAGAHADLTSTVAFNTTSVEGRLSASPKEIVDLLPPGFAGDLVDTPVCAVEVFAREECPVATQIGVQTLTFKNADFFQELTTPVFNLAPEPGSVAKFGYNVFNLHLEADVSVNPYGYGLKTSFTDIHAEEIELDAGSLAIWGVPSAAVHDPWRWNGLRGGTSNSGGIFGAPPPANQVVPYLASPTSCTSEPVDASISAVSWEEPQAEPSEARMTKTQMPFGPLIGCDRLTMPSTFSAVPTTQEAYAPTGLDAELGVHQTYEDAEDLVSAHLNKAVVRLPEGMTVNPSAGAGLGACTPEQYAQERESVEEVAGRGCPNDSKLGSVKITAPAIKEEAFGSVYLATPYDNPFSSLLALYVVARIPNRGVIVTSAGKVTPNPVTGQLTTVFEDLPQLPFTTFTLSFRQGETSPLVSPPGCGSFTATATLTPWSDLSQELTDESPAFQILTGFGGGACPASGVPPFDPGASAGTEDNDAGSYSPLDVRITRNDGEQEITGFASQLPAGATANLTGVPFCSEAEIQLAREKTGHEEEADPACPAASEIGHTLVGAGVGQVLAYAPGKVYMAGPFEGAPFSVVSITSADVGPFDLGTVVVHLPLFINPETAAVSIPAGKANQIPHIIRGIVIHVRDIRVFIDRPDFALNPTSCDPMKFTATVIGGGQNPTNPADNDPVTVTDPFQTADCSSLAFKPTFKVSTSGKTSRSQGASLSVKLSYPPGALGSEANIKSVKVDLPKQLPSRLTTLQKACTDAQFEANPAGCPADSRVGEAKAITPILPVPLEGPAYFVSHGGAKFPELIIVLQGYGVTLDLHGETFISKAGITSSTFHTIPDDPVGSFELTLPEGKYSALAANGNLCTVKGGLKMPTAFLAQNGAEIHESTKIAVSGCPKARKATKKKAKAKGKRGARGKRRK
jgi:hypothetical protein